MKLTVQSHVVICKSKKIFLNLQYETLLIMLNRIINRIKIILTF